MEQNTKQHLREVLYHHQWDDVGQWVDCLGSLSTLTDAEIDALTTKEEEKK